MNFTCNIKKPRQPDSLMDRHCRARSGAWAMERESELRNLVKTHGIDAWRFAKPVCGQTVIEV